MAFSFFFPFLGSSRLKAASAHGAVGGVENSAGKGAGESYRSEEMKSCTSKTMRQLMRDAV